LIPLGLRTRVFWASAAVVGYTYVGFPLLVLVRSRLRPAPYRSTDITPTVTVLVAAHNEARAIGAKLDNALALDYPADRLEIVVASDGSDDETEAIVVTFAERGVRLLALQRVGKAGALDAGAEVATGEILVFSDANSLYAPDAIRRLVRPFADPAVGGVAGNQRYRPQSASDATTAGEQAYWDFDRILKEAESRAGSTISATGAIYAIRRSLFRGVPVGVTDDFAVSTSVIEQGYRLVFAADAVAWEPVASSGGKEWGRKVRIMTRGFRGVFERRALLDPTRYGFYSVQLASHKVLRRLMGIPLLALALIAPALWQRGRIYRLATVGQATFYALGLTGLALGRRGPGRHRLLAAPSFFIMVNAAAMTALWNVVRGRRIDRWDPARSDAVTQAPTPPAPAPPGSRTGHPPRDPGRPR
jgi:cellulose synthase/poly-beta-1,6-N-acetylglucosamine synthase-like glycosyltransferase